MRKCPEQHLRFDVQSQGHILVSDANYVTVIT